MTVEAIKTKIWSIFDIFKKEIISPKDYHVVLFLLSAYKDGLISTDVFPETTNFKGRLAAIISGAKNSQSQQYLPIFQIFEPIVFRFSDRGFIKIIEALLGIDKEVLTENFPDIFDSVLYRIAKSQGRYGGEFIQPVELTRFICGLPDLPEKPIVFNPFAGLASFGIYLDHVQYYFGQEINKKTWALGALRIMAYNKQETLRYFCDDSILHWPAPSQKFDLIVANPPFGMRLDQQYKDAKPAIRTIEQFLLEKGIQSLKAAGKLIALLPNGFLFRGGSERRLREHLVEKDLVDSIIALPGGLLLNASIPLVIMVLSKAKKIPGKVRFIDAKNFVETSTSREKRLNDYKLNSAIRNSIDSDVLRIVSNETIAAYDFNLDVLRYFQKEYNGIKLGDIGTTIRGRRKSEGQKGKLVRIRDLKDDKLNFQLSAEKIDDVDLSRQVQRIEESCIIMALRWKTLKPTFFNYTGTPVFLTPDTLAFKVDESKADSAFLINELNAEYVREQLDVFRTGIIPAIKRDDLLNLKINLPSIEEQRAKVSGIQEISAKINQLQAERNALAHGFGQKQFNEFASLKHTLGTPRQNILSYAEALSSFFEKNQSVESDKVSAAFKEKMGVDLMAAFQAIRHDINFISELLEKGENGLLLSDYNLETINLKELEKLVATVKSASYNYMLKIQPLKSDNKAERGIICNSTLLRILLDNILMNAQKHGFDRKKQSNEVVIDLSELDDNLIIDIKNNGEKFPKGFDKEKFISKYSTPNPNIGTGIGGYDINRIIEYFKGTWDLILNEDTIYPVRFRIQFPIKPI